jgi:chemotaxis protein histidine kinase CheA
MAKQIKNSDLVQPKLWDDTVKETEAFITVLNKLKKSFKGISAESAKSSKGANAGSAKGIKDINTATETLRQTSIETDKVRAQIAKAEAQRTKQAVAASKQRASQEEKATRKREKAASDLIRQRKAAEAATKREAAQVARLAKQKEKEAIATAKATAKTLESNRAYVKASAKLNTLRKRFKDLSISGKGTTSQMRKLSVQIAFLDGKLKKVDKSVGQSQRNVGNYSSAFKGLGGGIGSAIGPMIGITAVIAGITAGLRAATGLFREFGLVSAKVQAVSGATASEFEALQTQAKELGRVTPFTATNVAELQLELSKLGLTAAEIGDSTEGILNFGIATDSALGEAGKTVASTINAFELLASDSGKVADVLTKAFSSSALNLEKFDTALGIVGATANLAGLSLEETTAILGTLVDAGVDASKAATGLRKVLAISANENRNYKDVLAEIVGDTNQLSKANELFGLTAQSQAALIAKNIDKVDGLTLSLQNAGGASEAAAAIIGDTLDGDIKKLTSAIQGATLENEGFEKVLRKVIQFLTKAVVPVFDFFVGIVETLIDSFKLIGTILKPAITIFKLLGAALSGLAEIFGINTQNVKDAAFEFNLFTFTLEILAKIAENINNTLVKVGDTLRKVGGFVKDSVIDFKNWVGIGKDATKTVGEVADSITKLTDTESSLVKFGATASAVFKILTKSAKGLFTALGGDGLTKLLSDIAEEFNRAFIEQKARDAIRNTSASVNELNEAIREQQKLIGKSSNRKEISDIQEIIQALEAKRDTLLGLTKAQEDNTKAQEDDNKAQEAALKIHDKRLARTEKFFKDKKQADEKAQKEQKKALEAHNKEIEALEDEHQKALDAKSKQIQDSTVAAIDVLDQAFAKASDNRINEIDREIQALQSREDALRQAAQNGSELAKDNLATNQRLQAEQERAREEQVKKAQRREIVLAGIKAFAENAGQPNAVGKTLTDITTLSAALLNLLPGFHDGTDDTGNSGSLSDKHGVITGYTHKNEMVLSEDDRGDIGFDKTRGDIKDAFAFQEMHQFQQAPIVQVQRFESNEAILNKFDELKQELINMPKNMPRLVSENFDEKSKVYTTIIKTRNKVEKNHKKIGGAWG